MIVRSSSRLIDVRPNWKEKPGMPGSWEGRSVSEE
jgi:hypothetical protein